MDNKNLPDEDKLKVKSEQPGEAEDLNTEKAFLENEDASLKNEENEENTLESENKKLKSEIELLKKQLDEKEAKCEEYLDMLKRTAAEYDNFKKRTQREKEQLSKDVICEVVAAFIPVADNLERAIEAAEKDGDGKAIKDGIEKVYKQFRDILESLDVDEISSIGEKFDPNLHNAVMHIEDDNYGENEIIEVFQKGYILKDKVIRHSVVKVAN
ncbi:MAG: nucleotide exchange factor GrpE [Clostridiaceae bacterium]|jgi:molecular chaperone GrpE|nr:nucleotide exchange factor GrpE [Clostridiaceae bacterium]